MGQSVQARGGERSCTGRMSSSRGIALNCGLAAPPTTTTCHTPNTPEILNAIVNISFPTPSVPSQASTPFPPSSLSFPPVVAPQAAPLPSPSYSDCSTPSSATSASPLNSPTGQSFVQHIQSQFIKDGLKMKVRQKLKSEPEEGGAYEANIKIKKEAEDLTPEDEERRRRRRERNKVAATKCRNKKKEKTTILVAESEIVEVQNASLKAEVARLDAEKRRLTTILAQHAPNCAKKRRLCTGTEEVPPTTTTSQEEQYDMSHTFRRPAAPGSENSRSSGGFGPSQEQHSYGGYSTNRAGECHKKEEVDEVEDHGHFTGAFKSEAKDYKYSSGEMYDVYNLMRQPQAALAEYSSSRGGALSYAGGYYDHMCLAL